MCDWDDFDDFEDDDLINEDSFEDQFEEFTDDLDDSDDESAPDDSEFDELNARDAFFLGGAMGFAYEEGLEERRHRQLLRRKDKKESTDW